MNEKVKIIMLCLIFFMLGITCFATYDYLNSKKNTFDEKDVYQDNDANDDIRNDTDIYEDKIEIDENNKINSTENLKSESNLVNYLNNVEIDLDKNKDNLSFKDKAKSYFTTIVDFLFYDSEINGYKFKDLTESTKLKVLSIVLSIDNKIDSYFPDYKDTIKDKMVDLKGRVVIKYLEITSKICENNNDLCIEAREDFNNMKNSYGFTWEIVKNAAGNGYSYLKNILNEWYKSIKE